MARSDEKILVVSGAVKDCATMSALFSDQGYHVFQAYDGNTGIRTAEVHDPDVILLDLVLPDLSGFDVCRNLRLRNTTWSIPIILLATDPNVTDEEIMRGLEKGANDYVKSMNRVELLGRVGVMLRMKRIEDKLRRLYIERTRELEWSNMELQKIRTQLILKNQMSTLGMMVAVAAHEIRSPAASISGNLELLGALLKEFTDALTQLPSQLGMAENPELSRVYQLLNKVVDLSMTNAPLDFPTRRKESRRIAAHLSELGIDYPANLPQQMAKFYLSSPELIEEVRHILTSHNGDVMGVLFRMGEMVVKLQNMGISIQRINAIVRSMKDYTHVDHDGQSEVNLHEGLDDTLTIMDYIFKGGITVKREFAPNLPIFQGSPGELNQVWTNILQNAYDAMNGRGQVLVKTGVSLREKEPVVFVQISDNGNGIPADVLPHIFDSFFTTKDKGKGSGLGLDICKRIIEKHNGHIEVDASPSGTTFTVQFPLTERTDAEVN